MHRLLLLLCVFGSLSTSAQLGGTSVFTGLNIPGSARVAALGGNYAAMKDGDINLTAHNPALLDSTTHGKLALSYVDYFAGTNMGYAAYARSLANKRWTTAATMQYVSHGTMTETDGLGNPIGEFSASEYMLTLGGAYQYDSLWSLGANFKTMYADLANYYSLAFAVDLAATYHKPAKNFTASFLVRNAGLQVIDFSESGKEKLPFELQVGFSKRPRHAPFRFSLMVENLQQWDLRYEDPTAQVITDPVTGEVIEDNTWEFGDNLMRHMVFGTEFFLGENLVFRFGYNYRRRQELKLTDKPATAGLSYGLGFRVKRFHLSYGRAIYHAAGPSNHFTVTTDLTRW